MIKCPTCGKECQNGTGLSAHMRYNHTKSASANQATGKPASNPFERRRMFSVIDGDVHLRGCEFRGGFLIVDGEFIQWFPNLATAISTVSRAGEATTATEFVAASL